ncbi:MAG: hypothetical protein KatS3mg115_2411 [Candidatus Poribacteria bacterium]|nr:MAG: hypothetical protein KatS3mg115_2411 [Candidatus Poribacteria bacterium]
MPKRHHQKTVGMMAVGAPTPTALEETFVSLYLGERDDRRAPYQACNAVQSYGDRQLWGAGPPEGAGRVGRNVEGWIRFLRALQSANRRVGEGNLRAILSRNLMGFRVVRGWSLGEIGEYVGRLCQRILAEELAEQVAGWWLADEGVEKPDHTDRAFREVVATVQTAQKEAGCAFPFFLAEELDSAPYWSRRLFGGWEHRIAPQLISWVETFSEVAAGARLVLMPFYYPWAANQWRSVSLPPPKKWELFFENLNRSFPSERYSFLEFQPILELSQQQKAIPPPAHTDVHRQIRWVWDRPRVSGVWFMGVEPERGSGRLRLAPVDGAKNTPLGRSDPKRAGRPPGGPSGGAARALGAARSRPGPASARALPPVHPG